MTDRQQDPNLPPSYRENDTIDTNEEMTKLLKETGEYIAEEDDTTCEHGLKNCNICDK